MNARLLATLAAGLLSVAPAVAHDGAPHRPELAIGRSAAFDYDPPAPGSYRLPAIKPAADAEVLDHRGRRVSLAGLLAGKVTVMAFIYTRCADVCPLATVLLHEIRSITALDQTLSGAVQLVTLSFDPENDTPEVMAMQAAGLDHLGAGAPWHFLTTDGPAALRPILDAYGQPLAQRRGIRPRASRLFHRPCPPHSQYLQRGLSRPAHGGHRRPHPAGRIGPAGGGPLMSFQRGEGTWKPM